MGRILEDISKWPIEKRKQELEKIYEQRIGMPLNLDNPKRFTEKTQWRKLYDDDPRITRCIDKLTFKQYVRERLGDGYTAPLIDVWHSPYDVKASAVPDKCILKSNCAGDSRFIYKLNTKESLSENMANEIKEKWFDRRYLHTNSFFKAYYPIEPCVIIEGSVTENDDELNIYKFFCFDGTPYYIYHTEDRFRSSQRSDISVSFYDMNWKNLGVQYGDFPNNTSVKKPVFMKEMVEISKVLSEDFDFVRVDFFETRRSLFLSEMTFTSSGGLIPIYPDQFDYRLGELWKLKLDK